MKTFCELGWKLSEAADYINALDSQYAFTIKVRRFGVLIEASSDAYNFTVSAREGLNWRDLHEMESIKPVIDCMFDELRKISGHIEWMDAKERSRAKQGNLGPLEDNT